MLPEITRILYATDLSSSALHALGHAAMVAERFGADLTVLHVLPDSLEMFSEQAGLDLEEAFGEEASHWLDKGDTGQAAQAIHQRLETMAAQEFDRLASPAHFAQAAVHVVSGDPAEEILKEVESGGFDLVVMGTHAKGGVLGLVLGSVAQEVVKHCPVPVMVVPLTSREKKNV
ncbi:MAG: universal stress protein [Desulfovibrio sp.]|uniref:universal stress protein n=1 Tax=Desulfovibrio sp. 7SRBS1 TaxID=3378064 RepID=UPI003B3BEB40